MKHLKTIIIIICIIILLILGTLTFIINKRQEFPQTVDEIEDSPDSDQFKIEKRIKQLMDRNNFYIVKCCVEKFYNSYSNMFDQTQSNFMLEGEALEFAQAENQSNIEATYNMLDNEYINYNNITKENITEKLPKIDEVNIQINKVYVSEQGINTAVYFVYGNLIHKNSINSEDFSMMVKLDMLNKTFKVLLQDYMQEKYANIKEDDNIEINMEQEIANDSDNIFEYKHIYDDQYAVDLFNSYRQNLLYNKQKAYSLLNKEYSQKRFKTNEDFEKYLQENISKIATMQIEKYQRNDKADMTQYVCIDQNGNNYIFWETAPMEYTVILDTYTIDLPEFISKYENSTDEQKVLLNIQRFFEAINNADYEYAYSKLDSTFKANNFANLEDFENYIKQNFYKQNKVFAGNAQKQDNVYMYNITIKDLTEKEEGSITKTFVMMLTEGTGYVMSFNMGTKE